MNPADLQELDTIDEQGARWIAGDLATLVDIGHDAAALWADEVLARALHPAGANLRRTVPLPCDDPVTACQIASGSAGLRQTARRDRVLTAVTVAVLAPLIPLLARGGWT